MTGEAPSSRIVVTLGELRAAEAEAFVTSSVASFVDDLVEAGIDRDGAETATAGLMQRLLPDGIATPGHRFRSIEASGRPIGRLWFGPLPGSPGDWYLFEIDIEEDQRRQGAGAAAVNAVISDLPRSMAVRLGLNVFESNTAARALYESLGFEAGEASDSGREMWLRLRTPR